MGKHKHKNKSSSAPAAAAAVKELSEADAAAGRMIPPTQKEESKPKRIREDNNKQPLTRKQKRQKLNDKNKWPQHPKITDPEQRAKAYLRVAGIDAISEDQEEEPSFPSSKKEKVVPDTDDTEWQRFGRFLGGTDARTRHKAVRRLGQYLKAKSGHGLNGAELEGVVGLSELDLLKLWKGLWFTLYMADKAPVQDELAKHIAKLMWCVAGDEETDDFAAQAYLDMEAQEEMELEQQQQLAEAEDDDDDDEEFKILETRVVEMDSDEDSDNDGDDEEEEEEEEDYQEIKHIRGVPLAMLMIRTFLRTLVREWGNMDKYRIDKFYTLVRYMIREIYRYMADRQWNIGVIKMFNDAIVEEALTKPPNGVRYHLIDIALEELALVATKSGVLPLTEAIFLEILEPYFAMAQHGFGDKMVQARVVEKVLERFLLEFSVVSEVEDKKNILKDVHVGTVSHFLFEMAGDDAVTLEIHRKSLYDIHKTYERQRKKTGTDIELGTAFQKSEEGDEDDDEDYAEDMDAEGDNDEETLQQMGFVAEDEDGEGNDDDGEAQEETKVKEPKAKESKKEKKNKKKRDKKKSKAGQEPEESTEEAPETPSEKSDKKAKKKKDNSASKEDMDVTHHGEGDSGKKKKHKKKKRDKEESAAVDEDVVTISMAEQKKAKQASKHKEEPAPEFNDDSDEEKGKKKKKRSKSLSKKKDKAERKKLKRRVSFDNHNKARSWKASMKGLEHLEPSAAAKTPEKSILLNKDKKSPISAPPKGRKRAVDYF